MILDKSQVLNFLLLFLSFNLLCFFLEFIGLLLDFFDPILMRLFFKLLLSHFLIDLEGQVLSQFFSFSSLLFLFLRLFQFLNIFCFHDSLKQNLLFCTIFFSHVFQNCVSHAIHTLLHSLFSSFYLFLSLLFLLFYFLSVNSHGINVVHTLFIKLFFMT